VLEIDSGMRTQFRIPGTKHRGVGKVCLASELCVTVLGGKRKPHIPNQFILHAPGGTSLSSELDTLEPPHLATAMSEAVAYAELGFAGVVPAGAAPAEVAALLAELREAGGAP
jgi:hypothetical protein